MDYIIFEIIIKLTEHYLLGKLIEGLQRLWTILKN